MFGMTKNQISELAYLIAAILVFSLLIGWITADKAPKRYYVDTPKSSTGTWCIYGDSEWDMDSIAFCSSDIDKVLAVHQQLNRGN